MPRAQLPTRRFDSGETSTIVISVSPCMTRQYSTPTIAYSTAYKQQFLLSTSTVICIQKSIQRRCTSSIQVQYEYYYCSSTRVRVSVLVPPRAGTAVQLKVKSTVRTFGCVDLKGLTDIVQYEQHTVTSSDKSNLISPFGIGTRT